LGGIGPRRYRNKQEAEIALTGFINAGIDNIDIGLMQVNLKWHGKKVSSPLLLLDPATNIMVASSYLEDINTREPRQAVADYHSPTNKQRGINYVNKVIKFERLIRE
jgi:soluble lytic murein transglycosylase-like protein